MKRKRFELSNVQIIALGFLLLILFGTGLLMLPFSSAAGETTSLYQALFTAVSASCVTGLVVVDTATHWSVFGQLVILFMIQTGGLGFVSIATVFLSFARKNLGLRSRSLMAESINTERIAGLRGFVKRIILGTVLIEGAGALILLQPFVPVFGWRRGIYYAVFHSVSAFCNAGFDLMGAKYGPFSSFVSFTGSLPLNITFILLITVGGIGFFVWEDVCRYRFRFRRYSLTSKIVIVTSLILTFGGAVLFYLFEAGHALKDLPAGEKIVAALFQSVTCRTAGFNTADLEQLTDPSILLSSLLMLIGGSPGSTAGGIKTTSIAVIYIFLYSSMRRRRSADVFRRSLPDTAIKKATGVAVFNLSLILLASLVLSAQGDLGLRDVLFEAFSAMGTVGMSTGITRSLTVFSGSAIMMLMFCGRVGSITLASAILERRAPPAVRLPEEVVTIG